LGGDRCPAHQGGASSHQELVGAREGDKGNISHSPRTLET
jgi:hypothetical protein